MKDITLIIPAKFESESLPIFFKEINHLNCKKIIILENFTIKMQDICIYCIQRYDWEVDYTDKNKINNGGIYEI